MTIADLTVEIAMAAAVLPDLDHRDPADRFLISTARAHDLVLVTRDQEILAYGARGHVQVMRC